MAMLVQEWMNPRPLTVAPETTLAEAKAVMDKYWIRHLIVVEGEALVGVLSDRDVRSASLPPGAQTPAVAQDAHLARVPVREAMTRDPRTVRPDAPLVEVARLMIEHRFSSVPVVDAARLVGILTETDILRAFVAVAEGQRPA